MRHFCKTVTRSVPKKRLQNANGGLKSARSISNTKSIVITPFGYCIKDTEILILISIKANISNICFRTHKSGVIAIPDIVNIV